MTERHYTDGTEPTVLPHFDERYCCDGRCEQGRVCPLNEPVQDNDNMSYWVQRLTDAFALIGFVVVLFFTLGYLSR